jgi:hypothetical protein
MLTYHHAKNRLASLASTTCLSITIFSCVLLSCFSMAQAQDSETTLYNFQGGSDGSDPSNSQLLAGPQGAYYGTTFSGGEFDLGTVFELIPPQSQGGNWTKKTILSFNGINGSGPSTSLISDAQGNLYGATIEGGNLSCYGGSGCGVAFELSPTSSGGWTEKVLHIFNSVPDGELPSGPIAMDTSGAIYGTTVFGGDNIGSYGTVYKANRHMGRNNNS